MNVAVLASGSSGNCVAVWEYVAANLRPSACLIDIGISCKAAVSGLARFDLAPEDVQAILITHAHGDHISGLRVWGNRFPGATVYAHPVTLKKIQARETIRLATQPIEFNEAFLIGDLLPGKGFAAVGVPVKHDCEGACSYVLVNYERRKLAMWGETGIVTDDMRRFGYGARVYVVEANHGELECLTNPNRPESLNDRAFNYHLSNGQARDEIVKLPPPVHTVFLTHLSAENNHPEKLVKPMCAEANQLRVEAGLQEVRFIISGPKAATEAVAV